jgi:hypothetical protein
MVITVNDAIQQVKVEDAVNQLLSKDSEFGLHCLIIYNDLTTFREFYSYYTQKHLENIHGLIMINPFYETVSSVRQTLSTGHRAIDVKEFEENIKTLSISDSLSQYFGKELVMESRKKIIEKAFQRGKRGLTVVADVGAFYFKNQQEKLVDLETSLPAHFSDLEYNGLCVYHEADFDRLSEEHKKELIEHHSVTMRLIQH